MVAVLAACEPLRDLAAPVPRPAVPSPHAAWTLIVWAAVVFLGEPYVVDVLGCIAYAVASTAAVAWWRRLGARR